MVYFALVSSINYYVFEVNIVDPIKYTESSLRKTFYDGTELKPDRLTIARMHTRQH